MKFYESHPFLLLKFSSSFLKFPIGLSEFSMSSRKISSSRSISSKLSSALHRQVKTLLKLSFWAFDLPKTPKAPSTSARRAIYLYKPFMYSFASFLSCYPSPHKCTLGFFLPPILFSFFFISLHRLETHFFPLLHTLSEYILIWVLFHSPLQPATTPVAWDYFSPTLLVRMLWRKRTKDDDGKMWKSFFFLCLSTFFGCFVDDFIARVCRCIKWQQKCVYSLPDPTDDEDPWYGYCCCSLGHKREKRINEYISVSIFICAPLQSAIHGKR